MFRVTRHLLDRPPGLPYTLGVKTVLSTCLALVLAAGALFAGGQAEAGGDAAEYRAGQGEIIPAADVRIGSWISELDYKYPAPEQGALSVSFLSGTDVLPVHGTPSLFQIGIQASAFAFDELPGLNLSFLVDASGSMATGDAIPLALDGILRTLTRLRAHDRVSVVQTGKDGGVTVPSTLLRTSAARARIKNAVREIRAEGPADLDEHLRIAYQEVARHARSDTVNRVILLSDGRFPMTQETTALVSSWAERGITLTTVGFGTEYAEAPMNTLSRSGQGSSRFASNDEQLDRHFYSELDRMIVPMARDVDLVLRFNLPVERIETWGYSHRVSGNTVRYRIPTLHHRDYETILAEVEFAPVRRTGRHEVAQLTVEYDDMQGNRVSQGPLVSILELDPDREGYEQYSNPLVLKSATLLEFCRSIIAVSEAYENAEELASYDRNRRYETMSDIELPDLPGISGNREDSDTVRTFYYQHALDLVLDARRHVYDAQMRLGEVPFVREMGILDAYLDTLAGRLRLPTEERQRISTDAFVRRNLVHGDERSSAEDLGTQLSANVPAGAGVLFPGTLFPRDPDTDAAVRDALQALGLEIVPPLPGTTPEHYQDNNAATLAGRLADADYILVLHRDDDSAVPAVYGRLIETESGAPISTGQRPVR